MLLFFACFFDNLNWPSVYIIIVLKHSKISPKTNILCLFWIWICWMEREGERKKFFFVLFENNLSILEGKRFDIVNIWRVCVCGKWLYHQKDQWWWWWSTDMMVGDDDTHIICIHHHICVACVSISCSERRKMKKIFLDKFKFSM